MKKFIAIIVTLILMNILSAEVCWDNGIPIYEGNFIYSQKNIITPSGNIYITWVEYDNGYRNLKLQKTNYAGEPIWNEPLTIDQSSTFKIENAIAPNGNDGCYINVIYDNNRIEQKLFKIDSSGNIVWTVLHNSTWNINLQPLSNGGILISQLRETNNYLYLNCINIDNNGNVLWNKEQLYSFSSSSSKILNEQYIDGFFYFLLRDYTEIFLIKVDENGEIVSQSANYPIGYYNSSSFIDNNFFVFSLNNETNNLEMYRFDLEGNSVLSETPKEICNSNYWLGDKVVFSDDYFYAILTNSDDHLIFKKCDFDGNVLATYTLNEDVSAPINQIYDYDTDFISCRTNDTYIPFLIKLNENGISEPIYYMPDNSTPIYPKIYFVNDNFSFVGFKSEPSLKILTMRKNENSTTTTIIRNVENDIIHPVLKVINSTLYAFWYSLNHNAIMSQRYDENGTNLNQENGEEIIDNADNFYLTQDKIITMDENSSENILNVHCYNFEGENIWSDQIEGNIYNYHIYPFNENYMIVIRKSIDSENDELKLMAFDENGFLWNEPTSISINKQVVQIILKGNTLFVRNDSTVSYYHINSDGTYSEPQVLVDNSNSLYVYGNDDRFIVATKNNATSSKKVFYFQNGNLMWNDPLNVNFSELYYFKVFFEDDGFYIIGNTYSEHSIHIKKFDYEGNPIPEFNFTYTTQNPYLNSSRVFKEDNKFIFYFDTSTGNFNHILTYTITDETGNILVPEGSETIMDREHLEFTQDAILSNNNLYLSIACGYKPLEGEYQEIYYTQKIDLSEFVNTGDENIPNFRPKLSNYPNPFNPTTTISFDLPKSGNVDLTIYNVKGQKVKTLTNEKYPKGKHSIVWTGKNDKNQSVSTGIYFYRLRSDNSTLTKKMILLK